MGISHTASTYVALFYILCTFFLEKRATIAEKSANLPFTGIIRADLLNICVKFWVWIKENDKI